MQGTDSHSPSFILPGVGHASQPTDRRNLKRDGQRGPQGPSRQVVIYVLSPRLSIGRTSIQSISQVPPAFQAEPARAERHHETRGSSSSFLWFPRPRTSRLGKKEHAAWAGSGFDGEDLLLLRPLSPDPGASPATKRAATITLLPFRSLHRLATRRGRSGVVISARGLGRTNELPGNSAAYSSIPWPRLLLHHNK